LQAVVTDSCGGSESLVNVTRIENVSLFCAVPPHPGITIGLEFESDRELVLVAGIRLLQSADPAGGSDQRLNVMTKLMRDYIRLGKVAGSAESAVQLIEEGQIEIHFVISRTIERSCRRLGRAARRLNDIAKENKVSVFISAA